MLIAVFPLPFPGCLEVRRGGFALHDATISGWCRPRLPAQAAETVGTERLAGRLRGDPAAGAKHVAGDGQFVGRGADVVAGVVQDEVLEMNEFAVNPEGGAGVCEILAFEEAAYHLGTGDAFVETGERYSRRGNGLEQVWMGNFARS